MWVGVRIWWSIPLELRPPRPCKTGDNGISSESMIRKVCLDFIAISHKRWPTFFLCILFSFFCSVRPTLPRAIFFPKIPSFWTSDLLFLVEKWQLAGAGFWGRFWTGSPHRKKRKILFFWRAKKGGWHKTVSRTCLCNRLCGGCREGVELKMMASTRRVTTPDMIEDEAACTKLPHNGAQVQMGTKLLHYEVENSSVLWPNLLTWYCTIVHTNITDRKTVGGINSCKSYSMITN